MASQPPQGFRPRLRVFEAFKESIRVYIGQYNSLAIIVLVVLVPVTVLLTLALAALVPDDLRLFDRQPDFRDFDWDQWRGFIAVGIFGGLLSFVASMVTIGACVRVVQAGLEGQTESWRASIRDALSKTASLIWIPILIALVFIGAGIVGVVVASVLGMFQEALGVIAAILLFGLFIYFFVLWSLAVPALMAEGTRGFSSLNRSRALISANWFQVLAVYLLLLIIAIATGAVLNAIFVTQEPAAIGQAEIVLATIHGIVSNLILTPLQAAVIGVLYFRLRSLKDTPPSPGLSDLPPIPPPPPPPPPSA